MTTVEVNWNCERCGGTRVVTFGPDNIGAKGLCIKCQDMIGFESFCEFIRQHERERVLKIVRELELLHCSVECENIGDKLEEALK